MDLIGTPGGTELGYLLLLAGTTLLAIVFAIQTVILSRNLRRHRAHSRQMEELAYFDPLTKLPNRRLLLDRLQQALHTAEREHSSAAVYFVDLDTFKGINDAYGHDVGDQVLTELSRRWSSELRATDTLARWGGDEFVVVTSGIVSADDIHSVVERLRSVTVEPLAVAGRQIALSLSIGVAVGHVGTDSPEDLIRCADAAMYRSKRSGADEQFEIVGRPECLTRITGLGFVQELHANGAGFVRVTA